jgi:FMN-dependent oxidoreductase (nitrilotriacetate monooxygenase family)
MFHLGWFSNYMPPAWNRPWAGNAGREWQNGDFYVDLARALDRGCFDYLLLEDSTFVSNTFGGNFELDLGEMVRAPKHDPMPLAAIIARETKGLGVVATANASLYPPYLLARLISTLDHISGGRMGWNVVTGAAQQALANFGPLPDAHSSSGGSDVTAAQMHDIRYDMADEFVELVSALWGSWDADAVIADHETNTYIDHTKVRTVDYKGEYYSARGPINTVPSPQYRPVIAQAGGSGRGRAFAAKHADTIVALPKGVEEMKKYRSDVRALLSLAGRAPDDCKIMYMVSPVLGETHQDAVDRKERLHAATETRVRKRLALMSGGEFDWSTFDFDQPLPEMPDDGQSIYQTFRRLSEGKTFRQALADDQTESIELLGTVDAVASQMGDLMDEIGGDGFLFYSGSGLITRRYIDEIVDGLVPALQRRGLTRDHYEHSMLRANLMEF